MDRDSVLRDIRERFKADISDVFDKSPKRVYLTIAPASVRRIARYLFKDLGARFNIASGTDARGHMEILYHFTLEEINLIVSLRAMLPKDRLEIDSLAPLFEAANWIEREMSELLGIKFNGHPEMKRLLLPDEWPQGVYPLRRDYKEWDKNAIRDRGV
ncbi:MAG: NADH-quinone oxidoreductase subunit C [Deltaproteobacteria bacterium]